MRLRRAERVALKAFLVCVVLVALSWLAFFLMIQSESKANYRASYTVHPTQFEYSPREYFGVVLPPCTGKGKDCTEVPEYLPKLVPAPQPINNVPEPSSLLLIILAAAILRFSLTRRVQCE